MQTYKALSVRQPYAWLLVNGMKTCENRTWNTTHRGTLLVHASAKKMTKEDWAYLRDICTYICRCDKKCCASLPDLTFGSVDAGPVNQRFTRLIDQGASQKGTNTDGE